MICEDSTIIGMAQQTRSCCCRLQTASKPRQQRQMLKPLGALSIPMVERHAGKPLHEVFTRQLQASLFLPPQHVHNVLSFIRDR